MSKYILSLDQGTTSSRSIIFNDNAEIIASSQIEHRQIFPQNAWVEHCPNEIWQNQLQTALSALDSAKINANNISALGITNQRETTVLWSRVDGKVIYNAIVWQDRRTSDYCDKIKKSHAAKIKGKTGLEVDSYFSASKINWLLNNIPNARKMADAGELCFGTIDSWIIWKLTEGTQHLTDITNASRTMLYNINTLTWDDELLKIFEIPKSVLPTVIESSGNLAQTSIAELKNIPITGVAGDQQAALFGQRCWDEGMSKNTYGTGCFYLRNVGTNIPKPNPNYLNTIAWSIKGKTEYAAEGSVFIAGAAIQWLRDALGIIKNIEELETLANAVSDNGGVYFVPAFTGLGTPYWDPQARGTIIGLTRGSTKAHIARAAMESIAFQVYELIETTGSGLKSLHVDGGATINNTLMQFQADLLNIPVERAAILETTALGAAFLAGLGVGYWKDKQEIELKIKKKETFTPKLPTTYTQNLIKNWKEAVKRSQFWDTTSCQTSS